MRILKLEFQNLNSLYGEWEIDFTAREYLVDGIFAITGATGAGKSTILDAISLALYGVTPRLGSISKSSNEIMTRGCGECYSRVTFEADNQRYTAIWSQKRAHGKEDGRLQDVRRLLDDADTGRNIADKIKDTNAAVEEKIGMTFEQFTRSMLLAQGEFAKFLNAGTSERAGILEKITDTHIYSEISKKVHVKRREAKSRLDLLQHGAESFQLLDDEDVVSIGEEITAKKELIKKCEVKEENLRKGVVHYKRISELEKEYAALQQEVLICAGKEKEFSESRIRIQRGEIVSTYWSDYKILEQLRNSQLGEETKFNTQKILKPEIEKKVARMLEYQQELKASLLKAREEYSAEEEMMKQVEELDLKIAGISKSYDEKSAEAAKLLEEIEKCRDEIKAEQVTRNHFNEELAKIDAYLSENQGDKEIAREYKTIEESLTSLKIDKEKIKELDLNVFLGLEEFEVKKNKFVEISDKYEQVKLNYNEAQFNEKKYELLMKELKGDKELPDIHDELKVKNARLELLGLLKNDFQIWCKVVEEKDDLAEKQAALSGELGYNKEKLSIAEVEKDGAVREVELLGELVRSAERVMTLEEHRKHLKDGQPCPLCGAVEHPYADGDLPEADGYIEKLGEAQAKLELAEKNIRKRTKNIITLEKDIESAEKEIVSNDQTQQEYTSKVEALTAELGLKFERDDLEIRLFQEPESLRIEIDTLNASVVEIEKVKNDLDDSKNVVRDFQQQLLELSVKVSEKRDSYNRTEKDYNLIIQNVENIREQYDEKILKISQALSVFGAYSELDIKENSKAVLSDLKWRDSHWHDTISENERVKKEIQVVDTTIKGLEVKITDWVGMRSTVQENLQVIVDTIAKFENKRNEIFGNKQVEAVKKLYEEHVSKIEKQITLADEEVVAARERLAECNSLIESLEDSLLQRKQEIEEKSAAFIGQIQKEGFESEDGFIAARIAEDEFAELKKCERELEDQSNLLKVQSEKNRVEYQQRLKAYEGFASLDSIEEELGLLNDEKKKYAEETGSLVQQLAKDKDNKELFSDKLEEIRKEEKLHYKWQMLHDLIGSEKGQKYRNYAQGLTFDIMLKYANIELAQMSDRYLLVRADAENAGNRELLDLEIIDKYQAQSRRSAKNLSGGESFIVSLALALGLSKMSSNKVQVNSLFLDEGFGTLDDEALDATLSALSRLHQQGKLIGIISHVAALKERISTQITVETVAEGRGAITGAGCRKIG